MQKEIADVFIKEYKLIRGKDSQKILRCIIENKPISDEMLPNNVSIGEINYIKELYQEKRAKINFNKFPRNLPFYQIIQDTFPSLLISEKINMEHPRIRNLRISLLSLLLKRVAIKELSVACRKYQCIYQLPLYIIDELLAVMNKMEVIFPAEVEMIRIVEWIQRGLNGEKLTIFSPICPDYSTELTGNKNIPFRHNFNGLGSGIGLVGKRIIDALPIFVDFLRRRNVDINIAIGFGDFEAFSDENLKRMNISEKEFLSRVYASKLLFEKAIKVPHQAFMIAELCGGRQNWMDKLKEVKKKFYQGDFGSTGITLKKLMQIVKKRKSFYSRWYGKKESNEAYLAYVINQGAEYSVVGEVISKMYSNILVVGADNDAMSLFYNVVGIMPTLYLKRYYC
jgi:hypothetical protein